mmetsp:Transcript_25774/g.61050  ORF Transcript_25774/g.61050 Transcript_25774/m.61050 type:complete len:81 (-) Transcript_25774:178-420(-)
MWRVDCPSQNSCLFSFINYPTTITPITYFQLSTSIHPSIELKNHKQHYDSSGIYLRYIHPFLTSTFLSDPSLDLVFFLDA